MLRGIESLRSTTPCYGLRSYRSLRLGGLCVSLKWRLRCTRTCAARTHFPVLGSKVDCESLTGAVFRPILQLRGVSRNARPYGSPRVLRIRKRLISPIRQRVSTIASSPTTHQQEVNRTSSPVWQLGSHIPQLDGVRGLAILMVTLYRFSKEIPTDSAVGHALHAGFSLGGRGVDLFFVLSGFLITGILLDAKGERHYFGNFLARRSLRIFPLYFSALLLFTIGLAALPAYRAMFAEAIGNRMYLWTYLTNIKMSLEGEWCFGALDHFWSLAVEEHFYLFWPVVLFFCSRRQALWTACTLALLSAATRIGFAAFSTNGVAPDVLTIFRIDALLVGAIIAILVRSKHGLAPLKKYTLVVLPVCMLIGLASAALGKRLFTINHSLWPLIWASCLIWLLTVNRKNWMARLMNIAPLRKLGKYSYAMYVFQNPLIPLTATILSVPAFIAIVGDPIVGNLIYMGVMFGLTFGAALLSWHLLERHCLKLKAWFPNHPKRPEDSDETVSDVPADSVAPIQRNVNCIVAPDCG